MNRNLRKLRRLVKAGLPIPADLYANVAADGYIVENLITSFEEQNGKN